VHVAIFWLLVLAAYLFLTFYFGGWMLFSVLSITILLFLLLATAAYKWTTGNDLWGELVIITHDWLSFRDRGRKKKYRAGRNPLLAIEIPAPPEGGRWDDVEALIRSGLLDKAAEKAALYLQRSSEIQRGSFSRTASHYIEFIQMLRNAGH
jgi:hypothetical protein